MAEEERDRKVSRRFLIGGLTAALALGATELALRHRNNSLGAIVTNFAKDLYSALELEVCSDAIVEVSGKPKDINQKSFLEDLADQIGVSYILINPEDKITLGAFRIKYPYSHDGVYFISKDAIVASSNLTQPDIERAALEYTISKIEGTNSVLVLGATWCLNCKSAKVYLKHLIEESFPEYRLVYFESRAETDEEFAPLDATMNRPPIRMNYKLPSVLYFGRNTLVSGGINTDKETNIEAGITPKDLKELPDGNLFVNRNHEVGYTLLSLNADKINSPPDKSLGEKETKKTVPVEEILRQNKK